MLSVKSLELDTSFVDSLDLPFLCKSGAWFLPLPALQGFVLTLCILAAALCLEGR